MLPIYNIVLGDCEGLTKMSLVEYPAVESDFLKFNKEEELKFSIDEEQHVIFGCALRANYPIYRRDRIRGEFYVVFDKEVIKELSEKFLKENKTHKVNLEHDKDTDGVYLISSFIKDKEKGINPLGFEDVEDGSWFCSYKVENEEVWNQVKEGKFRGFSVEVFCELEEKENTLDGLVDELLKNK